MLVAQPGIGSSDERHPRNSSDKSTPTARPVCIAEGLEPEIARLPKKRIWSAAGSFHMPTEAYHYE